MQPVTITANLRTHLHLSHVLNLARSPRLCLHTPYSSMHSIPKYSNLYEHWTYTTRPELLELDDRVKLAYDRAKAITLAWSELRVPGPAVAC